MIGYFIPGPTDDSEKFYCRNCSSVGIRNKLHELYLDRFQCPKCGRIFNRIDLENDKEE